MFNHWFNSLASSAIRLSFRQNVLRPAAHRPILESSWVMKKEKQQSFLGSSGFLMQVSPKKFFGGALLEGKRKHTRPLSVKDSLHFVLRSRWASGKDSFLAARNRKVIDNIITHFAKKFGVKIYERALNFIHLLLRITNRPLYRAFIKVVSGKTASQGS